VPGDNLRFVVGEHKKLDLIPIHCSCSNRLYRSKKWGLLLEIDSYLFYEKLPMIDINKITLETKGENESNEKMPNYAKFRKCIGK
jgi:hypothetical protein